MVVAAASGGAGWWRLRLRVVVAAGGGGGGGRRRRPKEVVVVVAAGDGCRRSWLPVTVVAGGHFCHLEKLGRNGIEFHQIWDGMMNSLNQGIHGIQFHSIGNQTTQWNSVNGIDHSNSIQFRRIPANQTAPKTSSNYR